MSDAAVMDTTSDDTPAAVKKEKKKKKSKHQSETAESAPESAAPTAAMIDDEADNKKKTKKKDKSKRDSESAVAPESSEPTSTAAATPTSEAATPESAPEAAISDKKKKSKKRKHEETSSETNTDANATTAANDEKKSSDSAPTESATVDTDAVPAEGEKKKKKKSKHQKVESESTTANGDSTIATDETSTLPSDGTAETNKSKKKKSQRSAETDGDTNTTNASDSKSSSSTTTAVAAALTNSAPSSSSSSSGNASISRHKTIYISPTARLPLSALNFHPSIIATLKKMNISQYFAVQAAVMPLIVSAHMSNDVCVAAPTGSGKTLTYVLPILQSLQNRVICRLRALVILPTRDLAIQVHSVFNQFCPALGLRVETAIGQHSFAAEQAKLNAPISPDAPHKHGGTGASLVDILVATPGRLLDHLQSAAPGGLSMHGSGFTLQHLQWLVIDEADRLLAQHYHDWISKVMHAVYNPIPGTIHVPRNESTRSNTSVSGDNTKSVWIDDTCVRSRHTAHLNDVPFQKLLFSATLTNNPLQLSALNLHNPIFFSETLANTAARDPNAPNAAANGITETTIELSASAKTKRYKTPDNLKEYMVVTAAGEKPLILIHLLQTMAQTNAKQQTIVFTASVESTHRLYRLLEAYSDTIGASGSARFAVAEYSSSLPQEIRTKIIDQFRTGAIKIIICSDAMARGMDLPNVDLVINYDAAPFIRTYIHRIGRTARAGRAGTAISLLRGKEVRHFKEMLWRAQNAKLQPFPAIPPETLKPMIPTYTRALTALKAILEDEKSGVMKTYRPLHLHRQIIAKQQQMTAKAEAAAASDSKKGTKKSTAPVPTPAAPPTPVIVAADPGSGALVVLEDFLEPAATPATASATTAASAKTKKTHGSSSSDSSSDSDSD